MNITTEFNIGDKVYVILNNEIKCMFVGKIDICVIKKDDVEVTYWLGHDPSKPSNAVNEKRCFNSLYELTKSAQKEIDGCEKYPF